MKIKETINEILVEILSNKIDAKNIRSESRLIEDLGAESMQLLEIALTIAAEFDINVPQEEVMNLRAIQDVYEFVARKKNVTI